MLASALLVVLLWFTINKIFSQHKSSSNLKEFSITIENTKDGLKMTSHQGSAWIDLSFSLDNFIPQAIDEYGMTSLSEVSTDQDADLTNYLFTIMKTEEGVRLIGLEGTAWKELTFSLSKNDEQTINQFGMK